MIRWIGTVTAVGLLAGFMSWMSGGTKKLDSQEKFISPHYGVIEKRRFVDGQVLPESQITIKPHISGVLEEVMVSVGDSISKGDPIARIKVLPDLINLEQAEVRLRIAQLNQVKEERSYLRNRSLYQQRIISEAEFERSTTSYLIAEQELESALKRKQIILLGNWDNYDDDWNVIRATLSGTVIEVTARVGSSVVGRNNFHEGTPVAKIADLQNLSFFSHIPEQDISHLNKGMHVDILIPAWGNQPVAGSVSQIAPQATTVNGIHQFSFQASLELIDSGFNPCGVTGVGEIVLDRVENVLILEESHLEYIDDSSYVELIEPVTGRLVRKFVKTGLSDGIHIEILGGLTTKSKVKSHN